MKLTVRYFASIREALGASETLDVADGLSVADVRDLLIEKGGAHAAALARQRCSSGLVDFQTVLETQRSQLSAQDS